VSKFKFYGYTHHVPIFLHSFWRKLFCRINWHLFDEVTTLEHHYLYCDACDEVVPIWDAQEDFGKCTTSDT